MSKNGEIGKPATPKLKTAGQDGDPELFVSQLSDARLLRIVPPTTPICVVLALALRCLKTSPFHRKFGV
ncbi:hypothetical protein [Halorientalis sp. IM1011]|uniref:hypothetical protein n=1 Tax=Halorientalis sp. IM1011 TaxID=1932360 RepID=UPI0012FCE122|nr:hypothetical protein [Halorientalis sp. IM1011]